MKVTEIITEAANPAQQAAIAISMKKAGKKPKTESTELEEEFDLIESIIERLAAHNGVDAEVIWEDLETLTEDELYAFAVTSEPIMESQGVAEGMDPDQQGRLNELIDDYNLSMKERSYWEADSILDKITREFGKDIADQVDQQGVAEAEKNPHTSALGRALYRDLSKEKKGQDVTEGIWGDFKSSVKKSLVSQAFYSVPSGIEMEIKGLIKSNNPDSNFWNMIKKDIADLPDDVQQAVSALVDDADLEFSHWPRGFFGGSKNIDTHRTKNLINILRKIKNIIEINDPTKQKRGISEDVKGPDEVQQIKDFIKWSMKTLNVKTKPKFTLSKNTEKAQGGHHTGMHSGDRIWVYIANRNLIDIFRTIFHELVHQRQYELNMIKDGDSYPGSPIEAMADMMAGKYIKIYGKEHPEIFQ